MLYAVVSGERWVADYFLLCPAETYLTHTALHALDSRIEVGLGFFGEVFCTDSEYPRICRAKAFRVWRE